MLIAARSLLAAVIKGHPDLVVHWKRIPMVRQALYYTSDSPGRTLELLDKLAETLETLIARGNLALNAHRFFCACK